MNKVRSSKRRCIFTKFYEAVPIHIALNSNTVNHLVYSYINPLFSTTWSQMLFSSDAVLLRCFECDPFV